MANTKLTPEQKSTLKEMRAVMPEIQTKNLNDVTVMAYDYNRSHNTVRFALANMSADEEKFRFKVGEYYALDRFARGVTVTMLREDFFEMCAAVWDNHCF